MRNLLLAGAVISTFTSAAHAQSSLVYSGSPFHGLNSLPWVQREADTIHVVVSDHTQTLPYVPELHYVRSADAGRSWAPAVNLGAWSGRNAAVASAGQRVHVLHSGSFLRSADDGVTWQSSPNPTGLGVVAADAAGMRCHVLLGTFQGPLRFVQTLDGGVTWRSPQSLGSWTTGDSQPRLIVDGVTLHVAWNDNWQTRYQRSVDGGATWLPAAQVLGPSQHDQLAVSGNYVHMLNTDSTTISYLRSIDGGVSWQTPITVTRNGWPQLAVAGSNVYVLGGLSVGLPGLALLRSTDDGASWSGQSLGPDTASFAIAARDNVVCAAWSAPSMHGIAVSADAGATWTTNSGASGGMPLDQFTISIRPPVVGVGWMRRTIIFGPVWTGTQLYVSGDVGATWHLDETFGTYWSAGPAAFVEGNDACGFLWSNGGSTNGSTINPTNLYYRAIHGHEPYGSGKAGTGAIVPRLETAVPPLLGNTATIALTGVVGGTLAMHAVSFVGKANSPLGGGVLLLAPPVVGLPGLTSGIVGQPGAGSLTLPLAIPNSASLHQLRVWFQGFALDANAADGFSSSAGLMLRIL